MNEDPPALGAGAKDYVAAALRSGLGAVPLVGPAFSEVISQVIPGVRVQRIEEYLRWLTTKLQSLTDREIADRLKEPEAQWVFEEGGIQAARATTDSRREHIANVVARGISRGDVASIEARRMLALLSQIDAQQIIILASYHPRNMENDSFWKAHEKAILGPAVHLQSPEKDIDKQALHDFAKSQLVSLGLLRPSFKKAKKGALPEFDTKTGMLAVSGYQITALGRMLLKNVGVTKNRDL